MNWEIRSCLVVTAVLPAILAAAGLSPLKIMVKPPRIFASGEIDRMRINTRAPFESTISIRVTNHSQVPTSTLSLALQVAHIFADAGIDMLLR